MRMRRFLGYLCFVLAALIVLGVIGLQFIPPALSLPPHKVASIKKMGLANEDRYAVTVNAEGKISRDQCLALIEAYRDKAKPKGQVAVRKHSEKYMGMMPWCVDNMQGEPILWNDKFFE